MCPLHHHDKLQVSHHWFTQNSSHSSDVGIILLSLFNNTCNSFLKIQSETYSWSSEKGKRYLKIFFSIAILNISWLNRSRFSYVLLSAAKTALNSFMHSKEATVREKDLFRSVKVKYSCGTLDVGGAIKNVSNYSFLFFVLALFSGCQL